MNSPAIVHRQPAPQARYSSGLHPLLQRVFAARNALNDAELDTSLAALIGFEALSNIDKAVALLASCLEQRKRILIVGDFDADGATSTALGMRVLHKLGCTHVDYLVPNRFEYGYGLTPEIVTLAARRRPDMIITVDNGISSHAGVQAAQAAGIQVLITDHHLPGAELPAADAIVNPNLPGDVFASKNLAGVGVLFYLLLALRARLRLDNWFMRCGIAEPNLAEYLDLVALGTIADLMPLDHNNRVLVAQGLTRIRAGHCVPGIQALLELGRRNQARVSAADLGFAVAPRINAAGRLTDMSLGIACLVTDDISQARAMAVQLDQLNQERRDIEASMKEGALRTLEGMGFNPTDPQMPFGLCLFHEGWHQGVVGLVASRIKERVHRPVIAFARQEDSTFKGSARSVKGVHIRDILEAVAARNPGMITKFGGHAMAAGLTIKAEQYQSFTAAFDSEVRRCLTADDLAGTIHTDGELAPEFLTMDIAELLHEAGPWGQGFPEPSFDGVFHLVERRVVGSKHLKLALQEPGSGLILDAIAFNLDSQYLPASCTRVHIVYRPEVNEYQGERQLQLLVDSIEPA